MSRFAFGIIVLASLCFLFPGLLYFFGSAAIYLATKAFGIKPTPEARMLGLAR
jgi:hypothetical protein